MKLISLYVYQSIDGYITSPDKRVKAAIQAADYLLIDEETYLNIYTDYAGWPITEKETFVVSSTGCYLTDDALVHLITGDIVARLKQLKATGEGTIIAYGKGVATLLLNHQLADEMVVITTPELAGSGTKALEGITDARCGWVVRSCRLLEDERVKVVYGRG